MNEKEMLPLAVTNGSELKSKIEFGELENASKTNGSSESKGSPEELTSRKFNISDVARRCVEAGLSVIPVKADGTKRPAVSEWKPFQTRKPTSGELGAWFRGENGLAIVGGEVSGNFEILDFDAPELFDEWCQLVEEIAPNLLSRLPLAQTPSGAYQLYYRCDVVEGNQKLSLYEKFS